MCVPGAHRWIARCHPPRCSGSRPQGGRRAAAARTVTMPDRFRFIGFVDGAVVADATGRKIPDPLPIDLLDVDLSWTIDFFEARKAGMAVELELNDGIDHLDELIVIGVRDEPAATGAARLRDLLRAHAYGTGLAAVRPGTATNNTPAGKSGWSSRPVLRQPGADPAKGERPAADALTAALGLVDAAFVGACEGMGMPSVQPWKASLCSPGRPWDAGSARRLLTHVDVDSRGSFLRMDPVRPWRTIRDHAIEHVRGRGPLPKHPRRAISLMGSCPPRLSATGARSRSAQPTLCCSRGWCGCERHGAGPSNSYRTWARPHPASPSTRSWSTS